MMSNVKWYFEITASGTSVRLTTSDYRYKDYRSHAITYYIVSHTNILNENIVTNYSGLTI